MTVYRQSLGGHTYQFDGVVDLLARATPQRSGDQLAGCAATSDAERAAAQWALAEVEPSRVTSTVRQGSTRERRVMA